jgi:hypothetical protein
LRLALAHHDYDSYVLKYDLTINAGELKTIGGHNACYLPVSYTVYKNGVLVATSQEGTDDSYVEIGGDEQARREGTYSVEIKYRKRASNNGQKDLFLQPNRETEVYLDCTITNLSLTMVGDYLGYTDSEFVSPTLIQNCINNYRFEGTGGWYATASVKQSSANKGKVETAYGRFDSKKFVSILDDFYNGDYTEDETYVPYMKMVYNNSNQFVLNSGIKDNRTTIGEMPKNEQWVLDYKILDSSGDEVNK